MADFESKYSGKQVEDLLDQIASGNAGGGGGITVETDPIFSASPAATITNDKITEWNNKVDKVDGKQLSTEDFTTTLKNKLSTLNNYDDTEIQTAVSQLRTEFDTLVGTNATAAIDTFNEIVAFLNGISTSDELATIVATIQGQISTKQDVISDLATIRSGAAAGATAVQPGSLSKVATSGSYNDLNNKPTIPAEQVNADWNATSGKAQILNKPTIPAAVTESTVSGWGFTKNAGTVTKVTINGAAYAPTDGDVDLGNAVTRVKINGFTYTPTNGLVDLGNVSGGSSGGSASGYPIETIMLMEDMNLSANPHTYYVIGNSSMGGAPATLFIDLTNRVEGMTNEYVFELSGFGDSEIAFNTDNYYIQWANGVPPEFNGCTTVISICEHCGLWFNVEYL